VVDGALRWAAIAASLFVITGFAMFASDEMTHASSQQVSYLSGAPGQERTREAHHSPLREAIDDVDDVLLAPFTWAEPEGGDKWARRGLPALVALVVYGFGLGFLARFSRGRA
jgi:hypothetical protein